MKKAQIKRHEERYGALCAEMAGLLSAEMAGLRRGEHRALCFQVEENVKSRAAFHLLEEIRALQQSGFDAERIVDALIEKAESGVKPARPLEVGKVSI